MPTRLPIGLMIFASTFVGYVIRVNLSISILGMVRAHHAENSTDNGKYELQFELPDVSVCVRVVRFCLLEMLRIYDHGHAILIHVVRATI